MSLKICFMKRDYFFNIVSVPLDRGFSIVLLMIFYFNIWNFRFCYHNRPSYDNNFHQMKSENFFWVCLLFTWQSGYSEVQGSADSWIGVRFLVYALYFWDLSDLNKHMQNVRVFEKDSIEPSRSMLLLKLCKDKMYILPQPEHSTLSLLCCGFCK